MEPGKSCCLLPAASSAPALAARCRVPSTADTDGEMPQTLPHPTLRCHLSATLKEEPGGPSSHPPSTWPSSLNPQPLDNLDGFVQNRDGWCGMLGPQLSRAGQMHQRLFQPLALLGEGVPVATEGPSLTVTGREQGALGEKRTPGSGSAPLLTLQRQEVAHGDHNPLYFLGLTY